MKKSISTLCILAGLIMTSSVVALAANRGGEEKVKVKVTRIVDGDTTVIEKVLDESSVEDFTRQFQNIKGKNVQVMITVENPAGKKDKSAARAPQAFQFKLDMDSATSNAFSRCFIMKDSIHCGKFEWNDSAMGSHMKGFNFQIPSMSEDFMKDFKFDFDIQTGEDGKTMIVKSSNGKTIIINGAEDAVEEKEQDGDTKTTTRTIIVNDDKTQKTKKVIISTSVTVIDMDDAPKEERKSKESTGLKFYPNPSDGNFTLEVDLEGKQPATVSIRDLQGKEIYRDKINGSGRVTRTLNLEGKKGTFIVRIEQGKKTTSKKIIIE